MEVTFQSYSISNSSQCQDGAVLSTLFCTVYVSQLRGAATIIHQGQVTRQVKGERLGLTGRVKRSHIHHDCGLRIF